jgi:succinate dehydrogenase (ubiquinone) cytochrome b560 subunit
MLACRFSAIAASPALRQKLALTGLNGSVALRQVFQSSQRLIAASSIAHGEATYRGLELELRNKRLGRPLSPFLSSYKMHFPMATSLLHRVSGVVYSSLYYVSIIGVVGLAPSFPALIEMIQALQLPPELFLGAKFVVLWPLMYHMLNGMRHLAWDGGWGFALPTVYKSGFTVLTITTLITAYLVYLTM